MNMTTTLTNEEKRIAIAEACGWKSEPTPFERHSFRLAGYPEAWWHPDIAGCRPSPPDYFNDLNACHEMEKRLNAEQQIIYANHLYQLGSPRHYNHVHFDIAHATAAQRAEAFLHTINP